MCKKKETQLLGTVKIYKVMDVWRAWRLRQTIAAMRLALHKKWSIRSGRYVRWQFKNYLHTDQNRPIEK